MTYSKLIWLMLSICIILFFSGCGGDDTAPDSTDGDQEIDSCPEGATCCFSDIDCPPGDFCIDRVCVHGCMDCDGDFDPDRPADGDELDADGDDDSMEMDSEIEGEDDERVDTVEEDGDTDEVIPTHCLTVDPLSVDFGSLDVGEPALCKSVTFDAADSAACPERIQLIDLQIAGEDYQQFTVGAGNFSAGQPASIPAGESHVLEVCYRPQATTNAGESHHATYIITTDSPLEEETEFSIDAQGTSEGTLFNTYPCPIDFGVTKIVGDHCQTTPDCPLGQNCVDGVCQKVMDISIYNWDETDLAVLDMTLVEQQANGCAVYTINDWAGLTRTACESDSDCTNPLVCREIPELNGSFCHIQPGAVNPGFFRMRFKPTAEEIYDKCTLRIRTHAPGSEYFHCPITGEGVAGNLCPLAFISRSDGGPPIRGPLTDVAPGHRVCLYGNISSDADGELVDYEWRFTDLPAGSTTQLNYLEENQSNACFMVDVCGDYEIELKVQDNEGCWSEPAVVSIVMTCNR